MFRPGYFGERCPLFFRLAVGTFSSDSETVLFGELSLSSAETDRLETNTGRVGLRSGRVGFRMVYTFLYDLFHNSLCHVSLSRRHERKK